MNKPFQIPSLSEPLKRKLLVSACLATAFFALSASAYADDSYYGTVEGFDGSELSVRTTKHSTGHWKIDDRTVREGSVRAGDWVYVNVATSGRIKIVRMEERPAERAGVIQKIDKQVLTVHSGPNYETWNLKETTLCDGVSAADLHPGDEIGVKLYKNHNIATLRVIKTGVGIK